VHTTLHWHFLTAALRVRPHQPQIPRVDGNDGVQADAESVASFFSAVCAAGTNAAGPALGGGPWSGMCTGCKVGAHV